MILPNVSGRKITPIFYIVKSLANQNTCILTDIKLWSLTVVGNPQLP